MNEHEVSIHIRLPKSLVELMDRYTKRYGGEFMNRSELVRAALKHYLTHLRAQEAMS